MTVLTDLSEMRKIRESGKIIKEIFEKIPAMIKPGKTTAELDKEVEEMIRERGGEPAFKGYRGFPGSICASINEVVVHGIPSRDVVLKDGDLISIDIGAKKNGYYSDAAKTFAVGRVSDEAKRLVSATRDSLAAGIKEAVAGNRLYDISHAIQSVVQERGFEEVRAFVGHGVGKALHEPPEVPNWGEKGKGIKLVEGLVLAIEPMVNEGTRNVEVLGDGWTVVTKDRKLSAHFEHTIIVGRKKAEQIT